MPEMVKVGVMLDERDRDRFAIACRMLGTTMSDVFRRAVAETILAAEEDTDDQPGQEGE